MTAMPFKQFLESTPPDTAIYISDFEVAVPSRGLVGSRPTIRLICAKCDGTRNFACETSSPFLGTQRRSVDFFLDYDCRDCRVFRKTYAVHGHFDVDKETWLLTKYGELPSFGDRVPNRVFKLVGGDRAQLLQGRRCENQGLGVGAFAYYRRVVESQKNRIFDEIIRVTERLSSDDVLLQELRAAREETQFTKAVERVKHALPASLFVDGHNPLTLLYSALSAGIHELDDAACLELATSIRVVLVEFSERLDSALKDNAELTAALQRLAKPRDA